MVDLGPISVGDVPVFMGIAGCQTSMTYRQWLIGMVVCGATADASENIIAKADNIIMKLDIELLSPADRVAMASSP